MKRIFTLLIMITLGFAAQAQIYVNAAATGSNNGTSWANAYTNLQGALSDASTANVWIAKGTYKAAGAAGDSTVFFRMNTAKNLYGGFAGTETALTQRNPSTNVTILSGDTDGNDKVDSLLVNRTDNRRHVLVVDTLVTGTVILDGLTISGGQTRTVNAGAFRENWGGGLLTHTSTTVNNCIFTGNVALNGGAMALIGDLSKNLSINVTNTKFIKNSNRGGAFGGGAFIWRASNVVFDKCEVNQNIVSRAGICLDSVTNARITNTLFSKNEGVVAAAGVGFYTIRSKNVTVRKCDFFENFSLLTGASGIGMYFEVSSSTIPAFNFRDDLTAINVVDSCRFRDNVSAAGTAAIRQVGGVNFTISNNEFSGNRNAASGSAVGIAGNGHTLGRVDNIKIINCTFVGNKTESATTTVSGGGMTISDASALVSGCSFENNSGIRGPHLSFAGATNNNVLVQNSSFIGATATSIGGATYSQFNTGLVTFKGCQFSSNITTNNGGAIWHGFKSNTIVDSCEFTLNSGANGGAIYLQNDTTTMIIRKSTFIGNKASGSGGALGMFGSETGIKITDSKFEGNIATGFSGALNINGSAGREVAIAAFSVDRCVFLANESTPQAGAINFNNKSGLVQNSIFSLNKASIEGVGGAISFNSSDTVLTKKVRLLNNTFDSNIGELASGIAVWQDTSSKIKGVVEFGNNLFIEKIGVAIEANKPTITSLGGNLVINDASKAHTKANDILDAGFKFKDLEWNLAAGSKAINAGIAAGAPTYDFNNKVRIGIPDIGAIEFGATVSGIYENLFTAVSVYPNPTTSLLTIKDDQYVKAGNAYTVFDINARILKSGRITDNKSIDVSSLNAGEYFLRVYGEKITQAKFLVVR